jgi:hypothetical protein
VINWLPRDLRSLANEARVPWDGLGHRLSWRRHRQARAAVVLTGQALHAPMLGNDIRDSPWM